MLRKKAVTLTYGEIFGRSKLLSAVKPQKITDEFVKAISRTLRELEKHQQDAFRTLKDLAVKYARHEDGKPVTPQQVMAEYQQRVEQLEEGEEPPEKPTFTEKERQMGFVLENEEAVAEAEQELLAEEVEVEITMCKYRDALTPEMTMADITQFDFMIDFESNGVPASPAQAKA